MPFYDVDVVAEGGEPSGLASFFHIRAIDAEDAKRFVRSIVGKDVELSARRCECGGRR